MDLKNIEDFKTAADVQVELDMIFSDLTKWTSDEAFIYTRKLWSKLFDLRMAEGKHKGNIIP